MVPVYTVPVLKSHERQLQTEDGEKVEFFSEKQSSIVEAT